MKTNLKEALTQLNPKDNGLASTKIASAILFLQSSGLLEKWNQQNNNGNESDIVSIITLSIGGSVLFLGGLYLITRLLKHDNPAEPKDILPQNPHVRGVYFNLNPKPPSDQTDNNNGIE